MLLQSSKSKSACRIVERKIYLTALQEKTLGSWLTTCCRLYNQALEHRSKAYRRRKERVSLYSQYLLLTRQRQRMPVLASVPCVFARSALKRLDTAFQSFFRRCKAGVKRKGHPRFRARHRYRSMEYNEVRDYFRAGKVFVPGLGLVTSRGQDAPGKQKLLRLIKRADAWYAQVVCEIPADPPLCIPQTAVGIDVGLIHYAALSTGQCIRNPRWYRKSEHRLRVANRRLARKQKGSRNRAKSRTRLAKIHEKISAQRKDFCHQESRKLVNRFDLIGFEALNIAGMARGRIAKSILDAAWGMFLFFVTYKAANAGRHAVPVKAAGTSQECPKCGKIRKKSLSERQHRCDCGIAIIDRDRASALVVEARALGIAGAIHLLRGPPLLVDTGQPACGLDDASSHYRCVIAAGGHYFPGSDFDASTENC